MKIIAHEPPWTENRFGVVWEKGPELWDGSGFQWSLKEKSRWETLLFELPLAHSPSVDKPAPVFTVRSDLG